MAESVEETMGKGRVREASIAPGGTFPDRLRLQEYDVSIGVGFLRLQCSPESGETSAHNDEIGFFATAQGRAGSGSFGSVEPKTAGACLDERQ